MNKGLLSVLPPPPKNKTGWPWTEETPVNFYTENGFYPKVSIVTPSFNQGVYIEETIRSILLQNYPNLEYIIIDGGSTDGAVEIIKKYAPWLTFWQSEKDRGQSHAINKGIARCTGEVCNWINSDDCLTKGALKTISTPFLNKQTLSFCGNALVHFERDEKSSVLFRTTMLEENINMHLANCSFSQPATFFKMSVFRNITPLEEDMHMNMDMYMWYRFVCLYGLANIAYTDEVLCTIKAHKEAKTVRNFKASFSDKQRVYDSLFVAVKKDFKPQVRFLPLIISTEVLEKITYQLLRKNYCRTHFWQTNLNGKILKINFKLIFEWVSLTLKLQ